MRGIGDVMLPASDKLVFTLNLRRSRLYFEALATASEMFDRGCGRFFHNGPHYYYDCLLAATVFDRTNALPLFCHSVL